MYSFLSECNITTHFSCIVGGRYVCLNSTKQCDGNDDCDDRLDEKNCQGIYKLFKSTKFLKLL